jgi:hypothetical protein
MPRNPDKPRRKFTSKEERKAAESERRKQARKEKPKTLQGMVRDNPTTLRALAEYLEKNK